VIGLAGRSGRQLQLGSIAGTAAVALTLVAIACTAQKKEDRAPAGDTTNAPVELPAPAPAAGAGTVMPDTVTTSASKETTRESAKNSRKPARGSAAGDSARPTGGERDSAMMPMYQIGPDGKLHRVKR
jgi:hypothetical protein